MSLVCISLVGNLTKPPEQMYFASGTVKTTMTVAVDGYKGRPNQSTAFYKVETWGKLAELAGKYLAKGNQVAVTGRLILDHWTDKQGKDRVTPVVEATQLALPPKNRPSAEDSFDAFPSAPTQALASSSSPSSSSLTTDTPSAPTPIRGQINASDESDEEDSDDSEDSDDTEYGVPDRTEAPTPNRSSRRRSTAYSTA
jgi:single-strand DNA-binding protein